MQKVGLCGPCTLRPCGNAVHSSESHQKIERSLHQQRRPLLTCTCNNLQDLLHQLKSMQPSTPALSQKPPTQPQLTQRHAQHAPSHSTEQDQQPPTAPRQPASNLAHDVYKQPLCAVDSEIRPVSLTGPLQRPPSNGGWLAQTQQWAAAVWNNEV